MRYRLLCLDIQWAKLSGGINSHLVHLHRNTRSKIVQTLILLLVVLRNVQYIQGNQSDWIYQNISLTWNTINREIDFRKQKCLPQKVFDGFDVVGSKLGLSFVGHFPKGCYSSTVNIEDDHDNQIYTTTATVGV